MSIKKIVTLVSILAVVMFALIVVPSLNQPVKADQVNTLSMDNKMILQNASGLTNIHNLNANPKTIKKYFSNEYEKVHSQPGCVSVKAYFGTSKDGHKKLFFIGVDRTGKEMNETLIAGPTPQCPPNCGL